MDVWEMKGNEVSRGSVKAHFSAHFREPLSTNSWRSWESRPTYHDVKSLIATLLFNLTVETDGMAKCNALILFSYFSLALRAA